MIAGLVRRLHRRDDAGMALVVVVILVAVLCAVGPPLVSSLLAESNLQRGADDAHAALAAAEAGVQWYRNHLNADPGYYAYTASDNPLSDPALSGWCGADLASTCGLAGTSPSEAFHYVPDDSSLFSQTGAAAGNVVLTVTGRGGSAGAYSYAYVQASFETSSILDNVYYSAYEVLDPNSSTIQGYDVTATDPGGQSSSSPEVGYDISYSYLDDAGAAVQVSNVSVWNALCRYVTYGENTFYDSLGLGGYSTSHPYYGPYLGGSFSFKVDGPTSSTPGEVSSSGTTTVQVPALPCGSPYDFVGGESFGGPVYTSDQLHVCDVGGDPQFNGLPASLTSGAPSDIPYKYDVPGSVAVSASNVEPAGPYPPSLLPANNGGKTSYMPAGVVPDTVDCTGYGDRASVKAPSYGAELNGTASLPSLNSGLAAYGTSTPPGGISGYGCTFTGPTMIELVASNGSTTMDVWSPLSSASLGTSPACSNPAGSSSHGFSSSTPFITGIPLPSDGVVYVQDYVLGSNPPSVPSDGSSPCFNPYRAQLAATAQQCYEGDVYVEGELAGQLTIGSSANIVVTRDLTYACSDGLGPATSTDPSSVSACTTSEPDVLSLSAEIDILVSGNSSADPTTGRSPNPDASTQGCVSSGFGDGTGSPANSPTPAQQSAAPYSTDPALANDPAAVWPTLCNPDNIVVDAGLFALNGSFGVENWDTTARSGGVYLNGSDLSEYRGPFGVVGVSGYSKQFSFDSRLQYDPPPHILQSAFKVWQQHDYVVCSTAACANL